MSDLTEHDWFLPAIITEGTVAESLRIVGERLQVKHEFIISLSRALCGDGGGIVDRITQLSRDLKEFDIALTFRLGVLKPDREAAWFRVAPPKSGMPFAPRITPDPVFAKYDPKRVSDLKQSILAAWKNHSTDGLGLMQNDSCLWRTLLQFKVTLEKTIVLRFQTQTLRLDELPEGLPSDLDSQSLRAFLVNVKGAVKTLQAGFEKTFQELWTACEPLWKLQNIHYRDRYEDHPKRDPKRSDDPRRTESKAREDFRERRQRDVRVFGYTRQALSFMGFKGMPSHDELRKQFLSLVKKYHPDRQDGKDGEFKALTRAYEHLLERIAK